MSEFMGKRSLESQLAGTMFDSEAPSRGNMGRLSVKLHHDVDTSQAEEKRLNRIIRGQAGIILTYLRAHGRRTRQEIHEGTGIRLQSVCPAIVALKDQGFVHELEQKRDGGHLLEATP